ncbi:MAG: gliding motility protein GldL [Bacteroidetes bacterium]|nr:MAG: gliding motility protein GldL [Bacteroidota bacterium]TAG90435.1 MAG: gliding motility protein GldL [Bacteroidota bacterium]
MSAKKMSGLDYFYVYLVPKITALGAAVVILGALFKIMHWPGAAEMLIIGMTTEAVLFAMGVAEPIHPEAPRPDWSKVYPQLAEGSNLPPMQMSGNQIAAPKDEKTAAKLAAIENAVANVLDPAKIENFGKGMQDFTTNVAKLGAASDASVATTEYAKNVKLASTAIVEMNKSYSVAIGSMNEMANATKDAKAYHAQVQVLTKNLTELNAVYETELRSASKHVKTLNEFYEKVGVAMQNVANASDDTQKFKDQLSVLTTNLGSLNKIYGGMLTAMKG